MTITFSELFNRIVDIFIYVVFIYIACRIGTLAVMKSVVEGLINYKIPCMFCRDKEACYGEVEKVQKEKEKEFEE